MQWNICKVAVIVLTREENVLIEREKYLDEKLMLNTKTKLWNAKKRAKKSWRKY